jgi:hypothetical protein
MIELKEYNEAGSLLSTFIQSDGQLSEIKKRDAVSRVDIVVSKALFAKYSCCLLSISNSTQAPQEKISVFERWMDVLLPAGYPNSVTDDYLQ